MQVHHRLLQVRFGEALVDDPAEAGTTGFRGQSHAFDAAFF